MATKKELTSTFDCNGKMIAWQPDSRVACAIFQAAARIGDCAKVACSQNGYEAVITLTTPRGSLYYRSSSYMGEYIEIVRNWAPDIPVRVYPEEFHMGMVLGYLARKA